jgi:tRNA threonylcarbamoyl adenosine modification protein (Sua5/YciO/YrdC/YwlC family)
MSSQAETFERCMSVGGVAVFPSDTVYGLACDPGNRGAVERLYALKHRSLQKASAIMFFDRELALAALPELGARTVAALERLLPGPVSLLIPNPAARFPLACGADPGTLGLRVVEVPALRGVRWPVLQSSANHAGGADARRLQDVPAEIRERCEMVIDGGELPGTASTVIDLRGYEASGEWRIVRQGGMAAAEVQTRLAGQYHFDPGSYEEMIRGDIAGYDAFQDQAARAGGGGARRILELGTGTGQTARRLLELNPEATLVGIDESEAMLAAAGARLPAERVLLRVGRLQDELPEGPFDLVASALCVHHLDAAGKRDLFARIRVRLAPGGRFVLADVIEPQDPRDRVIDRTPGYDLPDTAADQLAWLQEAGFEIVSQWIRGDLAVLTGQAP